MLLTDFALNIVFFVRYNIAKYNKNEIILKIQLLIDADN
jgi:hypothetical protein